MAWYDSSASLLAEDQVYSHRALMEHLRRDYPALPDSSLRWAIDGMIKGGFLKKRGYDEYIVGNSPELPEYQPVYSNAAQKLIDWLSEAYPYVSFTLFETVLMNDFLNHLVAQNTIFIQAEKESGIFLFRFLQEQRYADLLYKPSKKDFSLYWARDCVVVTDLISEAPIREDAPHSICLEKLLVDMIADRLISTTYSKAEYADVLRLARSQYRLDKAKMLRYARRRNKGAELKKYLEGLYTESIL